MKSRLLAFILLLGPAMALAADTPPPYQPAHYDLSALPPYVKTQRVTGIHGFREGYRHQARKHTEQEGARQQAQPLAVQFLHAPFGADQVAAGLGKILIGSGCHCLRKAKH